MTVATFRVELSAQHTIVPPHFTASDLLSPNFRKRNHFHVDKAEITGLVNRGEVEMLDEKRRIWRRLSQLCVDSIRARSSRIYSGIPASYRSVIREAITGQHIYDEFQAAT